MIRGIRIIAPEHDTYVSGALFLGVAAGYAKAGRDRIEKDPDQRVQDALKLVFSKFAEFQSVRQVHVWLRDEGIALPVKSHKAAEGRCIVWRLPLYNTVHNILQPPKALRPEGPSGAESCCWLGFCAVAIAVASCMWAMAARRGAITARAGS